jgi:V-type H+-transporting ATPase subunit E
MEPTVTIHCRVSDVAIVQQAVQTAQNNYKEISGRNVDVDVEGDLSKESAGGVRLVAANGRITLDNTLDERLKLLEEKVGFLVFIYPVNLADQRVDATGNST